jgi:hypothetical protein
MRLTGQKDACILVIKKQENEMNFPKYEIMLSGRKAWPYMVRKNACAVAYFKNSDDAESWCKEQ